MPFTPIRAQRQMRSRRRGTGLRKLWGVRSYLQMQTVAHLSRDMERLESLSLADHPPVVKLSRRAKKKNHNTIGSDVANITQTEETPAHRNLQSLLKIPNCASDISEVISLVDPSTIRHDFTTNGACDPRKLDLVNLPLIQKDICKQALESEVCFYPFGGADTLAPALLTDASVVLMTGGEPWGYVEDVEKLKVNPLRLFGIGSKTNNLDDPNSRGTFDSLYGWTHTNLFGKNFKIETSKNTMGPHAIPRAIAAEMLRGREVESVHVASLRADNQDDGCLLDDKNEMHYVKMGGNLETKEPFSQHVSFWITMKDGKRKAYVYKAIHLKDDDYLHGLAEKMKVPDGFNQAQEEKRRVIADLHQVLSKISNDHELVLLEKAIPQGVLDSKNSPEMEKRARELVSPPEHLIKAVVCDEKLNQKVPQTIGYEGLNRQDVCFQPFGTTFGYGETLHVFSEPGRLSPISIKAAYPVETLYESSRVNHRKMFADAKVARNNIYNQEILAGQKGEQKEAT